MPPKLSDEQVAELARQQATLDLTDEQVALQARQQATQDALAQGPPPFQPAAPESGQNFLSQYVKPAVLPTGMGIAGSALGGGIGTPFGLTVPGQVIGGGIGSGVGEAANQALGITEPSLGNIAMATGVPMAIGAGAAALTKAAPFLLPGRVAQALNVLGPQAAAAKVGAMQPLDKSSELFDLAAKAQVKIPMNRTLPAIDNMLDDLTNVSAGVQRANATAISYLKDLRSTIQTAVPGMDPMRLQKELEGAGHVIKSVRGTAGSGEGAIKNVFSAMVKDLDDAAKMGLKMNPGGNGVQALVAARQAFKREQVLKDIGKAIDKATKTPTGQGELVRFDAGKVITKLRTDERLSKFYNDPTVFTDAERASLEKLLYTTNKIPGLRPASGQQFGSGAFWNQAATAAGGGGVGFAAGGPVGAGIGTAVGVALPAGTELAKDYAVAIQLESGRALLGELLKQSRGSITPQVASIIAAYAHAVQAGQVKE